MALSDYILCCKCDTKLIYDGDRGNRKWWEERFGAEPEILCPKCDKREWVGLTLEESLSIIDNCRTPANLIEMVEDALRSKNT